MNVEKLHIYVKDRDSSEEYPSCRGEIQIGDFKEGFTMPLDAWTIEDYEQQWKKGLERIKTHETSCLVAKAQNPAGRVPGSKPLVELWVLYKVGKVIYIQNNLLIAETLNDLDLSYKDLSQFNKETCYQYITLRETFTEDGDKTSEWQIKI